ncbi:MAG: ribonuclease H-like domain-containing protein [Candidatus Dormibacter sp.]
MNGDLDALRARLAELGARHARRAASRAPQAAPIGTSTEETPFGPVAVREEWFAEDDAPATEALARCLGLEPTALESPLYLDTETTGLSGGSGVVAFLIGLAWRDGDGIRLAQYFLQDLDQEPALLWAVGQRVSRAGCLVTYNGRTFDWPLLQTRLVMRRVRPAWSVAFHLDLLPIARRIFRPRLPDCALQTIEQAVLDLHRHEDLPGWMIPGRYFAWLRGAGPDAMEPIFAHNRQDVLSMARLVDRLDALLANGASLHPLDRFSRARFLQARGFDGEAIGEYRYLWDSDAMPGTQRGAVGLRLARLLRRQGRWHEAKEVLDECWRTQCYPYPAAIELAKLLEHQARDPAGALRVVAEALNLLTMAVIRDDRWRVDLEQRRHRLDVRVRRASRGRLALTG